MSVCVYVPGGWSMWRPEDNIGEGCVCVLLRFKSKAPHITDHALPELHPSPLFVYLFVIFVLFFWDKVLLCSPGCPWTRYVAQAGLLTRLSRQSAELMDTYHHA